MFENNEPSTIRIGDREAHHVGHYASWGHALWTANYVSTEYAVRTYLLRCVAHQRWVVWRTNVPVVVKTYRDVMICSQCGQSYPSPACGPTHALQWYRLQKTGIRG